MEDEVSEDLIFGNDTVEQDNTLINFNGHQIKPVKIVANLDNVDVDEINNTKTIDELFLSTVSYYPIISILIFLTSIVLGILSSLPLLSYGKNRQLETLFDEATCIIRMLFGILIFSGSWFEIIDNCYQYLCKNKPEHQVLKSNIYLTIIKMVIIIVFAAIYSILYAWNYWILPDVLIKYISVPCYFLVLLRIFYQRAVIQFQTRADSSEVNRKKNILIASIKRTLKICKNNAEHAALILKEITNTEILPDVREHTIKHSFLFAIKNDHTFYRYDKEDLTNRYENDIYDKWETIRTNLLNIFLGIAYVALMITLINQYENLVVDIFHSFNISGISHIHGILWGSTMISIIEAGLFILATYNIHHNYLRKFMSITSFKLLQEKLRLLIIYSPMIVAGVILAMTRLESSYIAFAKLATMLMLNKDIGYMLISIGMALSFLVEMNFMIKTEIFIMNSVLRNIITSRFIPNCMFDNSYLKHKRDVAHLIVYGKRMVAIIRNLTDDCVLQMMKNILHR